MNSYLRKFAQALDGWAAESKAVIVETPEHIIVSQLSSNRANDILKFTLEVGWTISIEDASQSLCDASELSRDFQPYRITIEKTQSEGSLSLLTATAFRKYLEGEGRDPILRVACLNTPFDTLTRRYTHWSGDASFKPA